jgi:GxxExxY protein
MVRVLHSPHQIGGNHKRRGHGSSQINADLIVENRVVVEVKALRSFVPEHEAQLLHYLRATAMEVGLLLNFGPRPQFQRLIYSNALKRGFPVR